MKTKSKIRGMLFATTAMVAITTAASAPAFADATTDTLLALLAKKGVITASEAQSVTLGPAASQQERLVALLRQKGVLGAADVQALSATKPSTPAPVRVASVDPTIGPAPMVVASADHAPPRASAPRYDLKSYPMPTKSPLAVEAFGITITPVGFVDLTGVWRSRNTGSNLATSFGAIPFDNTIQGNNSETRLSAQNSRFGLKAEGSYNDWLHILGYLEGDFNGNDPANVWVTSNSHTFRLRQAFMDVDFGNWEFIAGQAYSWMTPNRRGLSAAPTDVFTTLNIDQSLQVGLPWTRAAQARLIYHATPEFALGIGVENPDQFVGAGEVIFPFAFNAALNPQFDAANQTTVPNAMPDLIAKAAYDSAAFGHRVHLEAAGLLREFKSTNVPIGGADFVHHTATGWGASVAGSVEIVHGFNVLGNVFWSQGGGRYLGGLGPDLVVMPNAAATDVSLQTVESNSYLVGAEWYLNRSTVIAGYYGATRFKPNAFDDTTSPLVIKPTIGFGGVNSPNSANGKINEATFDLRHTFWSDPRFGALQGLMQYSFVKREPNFVPTGAPTEATVHMFFASMRYHLPGGMID